MSAAAIGLINALVWPLLIRVALPFTVLTLGLGVLALNGAVVLVVAELDPGMHGRRPRRRDRGRRLRPHGREHGGHVAARDRRRRLLVPQRRQAPGAAAAAGGRPRRAGRLLPRDRRPRPRRAAAGDSRRQRSQPRALAARRQTTGCCAGRPTGRRRPAPARRGCCTATTTTCRPSAGGRRTAARAIVTNHPRDAAEIERRHSNGRGLLHEDGASRANIVSGDAVHTLLTMSTVLDRNRPGGSARTTSPTSRTPTTSPARSRW